MYMCVYIYMVWGLGSILSCSLSVSPGCSFAALADNGAFISASSFSPSLSICLYPCLFLSVSLAHTLSLNLSLSRTPAITLSCSPPVSLGRPFAALAANGAITLLLSLSLSMSLSLSFFLSLSLVSSFCLCRLLSFFSFFLSLSLSVLLFLGIMLSCYLPSLVCSFDGVVFLFFTFVLASSVLSCFLFIFRSLPLSFRSSPLLLVPLAADGTRFQVLLVCYFIAWRVCVCVGGVSPLQSLC